MLNKLRSVCRMLLLTVFAGSGCHLPEESATTNFASVIIANHSASEIKRATVSVFLADGYTTVPNPEGTLVFERTGTRKQQMMYSGWLGDAAIHIRVRAEVLPLNDGTHRLQTKAQLLRAGGDAFFEEDVKMAHLPIAPFQELLERVAARLR